MSLQPGPEGEAAERRGGLVRGAAGERLRTGDSTGCAEGKVRDKKKGLASTAVAYEDKVCRALP